jgi:hypothetical protein
LALIPSKASFIEIPVPTRKVLNAIIIMDMATRTLSSRMLRMMSFEYRDPPRLDEVFTVFLCPAFFFDVPPFISMDAGLLSMSVHAMKVAAAQIAIMAAQASIVAPGVTTLFGGSNRYMPDL